MKKNLRNLYKIQMIFLFAACCFFVSSTISYATTYKDGYLTYTENEDGSLTVTDYDRSLHESPYTLKIYKTYLPEGETEPKEITAIGDSVFKGYSFESVFIEGSPDIKAHAFENVTLSHDLGFLIGASPKYIGDAAFKNTNINSLQDDSRTEYIGDEAFCGSNLRIYTISNSLKHIGANAFSTDEYTYFTFKIDSSVTDLDQYDFDFTSPESKNYIFRVHKDSPLISWLEDNYLYYMIAETGELVTPHKKIGEIIPYSNEISFIITGKNTAALNKYSYNKYPDGRNCLSISGLCDFTVNGHTYIIDTINSYSVSGDTIDYFDMRESNISYVYADAFKECSRISSIWIPDNIKTIEKNAFPNSSNLTIFIPSTVTDISGCDFSDLTNVTFSVKYGSSVIDQLEAMHLKYEYRDAPEPEEDSNENTIQPPNNETPNQEAPVQHIDTESTDNTLPNPSTSVIITINKMCYKIIDKNSVIFLKTTTKNISSLNIPSSIKYQGHTYKVTRIDKKACYQLTKLKNVTIGSNVYQIGDQAFAKCNRLKSITFGKNIKKIGKKVLYNDKNLKTITFKTKKLTSIGKKTFHGIPRKVNIRVPNSKVKKYSKIIYNAQ